MNRYEKIETSSHIKILKKEDEMIQIDTKERTVRKVNAKNRSQIPMTEEDLELCLKELQSLSH